MVNIFIIDPFLFFLNKCKFCLEVLTLLKTVFIFFMNAIFVRMNSINKYIFNGV